MEKTYSSKSNAARALAKFVAANPQRNLNTAVLACQSQPGRWFYMVEDVVETPNPVTPAAPLPHLAKQFVNLFTSYQSGGYSKCKSLRATAQEWQANGNSRQQFVLSAVAHGIKPATAGANWAAMKRGEL